MVRDLVDCSRGDDHVVRDRFVLKPLDQPMPRSPFPPLAPMDAQAWGTAGRASIERPSPHSPPPLNLGAESGREALAASAVASEPSSRLLAAC